MRFAARFYATTADFSSAVHQVEEQVGNELTKRAVALPDLQHVGGYDSCSWPLRHTENSHFAAAILPASASLLTRHATSPGSVRHGNSASSLLRMLMRQPSRACRERGSLNRSEIRCFSCWPKCGGMHWIDRRTSLLGRFQPCSNSCLRATIRKHQSRLQACSSCTASWPKAALLRSLDRARTPHCGTA